MVKTTATDARPEGLRLIIPTRYGLQDSACWLSWMQLERPRGMPWGWLLKQDLDGAGAHGMRNMMVAEVRAKRDPEWYFLIDDDTIVPADAVLKMLRSGEKIVAGAYAMRRHGEATCLIPAGKQSAKMDWRAGEPFYGYAAAGCMLVHRDVFDGLRSPWFEDPADTGMDEGIRFCRKAEEIGHKCLIDTSILCGHVVRDGLESVKPQRIIWPCPTESVPEMESRP